MKVRTGIVSVFVLIILVSFVLLSLVNKEPIECNGDLVRADQGFLCDMGGNITAYLRNGKTLSLSDDVCDLKQVVRANDEILTYYKYEHGGVSGYLIQVGTGRKYQTWHYTLPVEEVPC